MKQKHHIGALRKREVLGGILGWPMFLLGSQLLLVLVLLIAGKTVGSVEALAWFNVIATMITLAILLPFFLPYLRQQFTWLTTLRGKRFFGDFGIAVGIYFGLSYAVNLLLNTLISGLSLIPENGNQEIAEQLIAGVPSIMILDVCLLAPLTEELLCRGLLFCGIYRHSRFWAYAVSMTAFALAHVFAYLFSQPPLISLINFISYLPAGFVLAWIYERSESIWASIFLHALINGIALLVLFSLQA